MKARIVLLFAAAALLATAHAQQKAMDITESSWQGYIVDVKTAGEFLKQPESTMAHASAYTKAEAVKMQSNGFGIFTDGKWLKFDDAGNTKTQELIKKSTAEKGILVLVSGMLKGEAIAVSSVKEYKKVEVPN